MAQNNAGKPRSREAPELGELHKMLGKTPAQVDEALAAMGFDPQAMAEAMGRLARVLAAKYAPQVEAERAMAARAECASYPMFDECVAAGLPEWAAGAGTARDSNLFALLGGGDPTHFMWARVSGWSMRDAGINDGGVVLVNRKAEPKDGDIVLAHLAGQGQLIKRLRIAGADMAVLESANPDFADIEVADPASMTIHGVVVGHAGTV